MTGPQVAPSQSVPGSLLVSFGPHIAVRLDRSEAIRLAADLVRPFAQSAVDAAELVNVMKRAIRRTGDLQEEEHSRDT